MRVGIIYPVPEPLAPANWSVSASSRTGVGAGLIAALGLARKPIAPGRIGGDNDV